MAEPKVATITISTEFPNCKGLVLHSIGKYLPIDDEILGIKYQGARSSIIKGLYATTVYRKSKGKDLSKINSRLFYNQVTLVLNNDGNNVNVKLFGNGCLHLTGCKSVEEGEVVTRKMWKKLRMLDEQKDHVLLAKDENNVYMDKDNMVYSHTDKTLLGYKTEDGTYMIHKKEYEIDVRTRLWISRRIETKRQRSLLNFDGVRVGYTEIHLLKNTKKLYKKNSNLFHDKESGLIYYDSTIIGEVKYIGANMCDTSVTSTDDVVEIEYVCSAFVERGYSCEGVPIPVSINCMNLYFNLGSSLNRQKVYRQLIDMNFNVNFNPETYSGIKLLFKIPWNADYDSIDGKCKCSNKCTCTNITALIFQSGNVIMTGFKEEKGCKVVCDAVKALIHDGSSDLTP